MLFGAFLFGTNVLSFVGQQQHNGKDEHNFYYQHQNVGYTFADKNKQMTEGDGQKGIHRDRWADGEMDRQTYIETDR